MSMYLLLWCYNNRRSTLNTFILFSAMTVHTIVDPILATADIIILHVNCIAATATVCIGSCRIGAAAVELGGGEGGGAVGGWGGVVGGGLGWGGGGGGEIRIVADCGGYRPEGDAFGVDAPEYNTSQ